MNINFSVLFDHSFSKEQWLDLPNFLSQAWEPFKELWPSFEIVDVADDDIIGRRYWNWDPQLEDPLSLLEERGFLELHGPCGFRAMAGPGVIAIGHGTEWLSFFEDDTVQYIMQETSQIFAGIFQAREWIYLPHALLASNQVISLVCEGQSLTEIESWLLGECGPPLHLSCAAFADGGPRARAYAHQVTLGSSLEVRD